MSHFVEGSHRGFKAAADLSGHQFGIVKTDANGNIVKAAAATDILLGTLVDKPTLNRTGDVRLRSASGTLNVKVGAGGAIAKGDAVTSDANGLGITTTTAGNQLLGYAMEAGAVGAIIEILPSLAKY
jgi:hypothetical protein